MSLQIKICGLRFPDNIKEIARLNPDIAGFIFYKRSPRYAGNFLKPEVLKEIPPHIMKAGVFVNEEISKIKNLIEKYSFDIIQLHGGESPIVCSRLKAEKVKVIKAFSIHDGFGFSQCNEYADSADYFLFDNASGSYGGTGKKFDWNILGNYSLNVPFFLSGGISANDSDEILKIRHPAFMGVDINSRFEDKPGYKNIPAVKNFISQIRS